MSHTHLATSGETAGTGGASVVAGRHVDHLHRAFSLRQPYDARADEEKIIVLVGDSDHGAGAALPFRDVVEALGHRIPGPAGGR
ncbi:hypothetical protein [Streptomyces hirsutus]|uniref:hypothetical protein n=1 Tax=Streptomyces hirsutus TaxID=35620 RepID=UPI000B1FDB12|nr:hypothetical protein [Streptomyces hirsutus]